MTRHFLMYFAFALSVSLMQCSKTTVDPNGLPPETQTGAGTFACKINGVVWQYKDPNYEFLSTKPVTHWEFDNNSYGGILYLNGLRYLDGINENDFLNIGLDSLNFKKEAIVIPKTGNFSVSYIIYKQALQNCSQYSSNPNYDTSNNFSSSGKLNVTRFDKVAKIISGNFYCTIKQSGCDTLKITDGRFDIKYQ